MAQLLDTTITGNLNVSGEIQLGNRNIGDEITNVITIVDNMDLTIQSVSINVTLLANSYVHPFTYHNVFSISDNDIETYGEPISISARDSASAPVPVAFRESRRAYVVNSMMATNTVEIVFIKLKK